MGQQPVQPESSNNRYAQKNGLSTYELYMLQEYFNNSAAIDRRCFNILYATLNPEALGPYFDQIAAQAFYEADLNRDGYISFDEFIKSFIQAKRQYEMRKQMIQNQTTNRKRLFP